MSVTTPTMGQDLDALLNTVRHGKFNLRTVEKFLYYALGVVALVDPSGVMHGVIREISLGASAFLLGATHVGAKKA